MASRHGVTYPPGLTCYPSARSVHDSTAAPNCQVLEQVWRASPRTIEGARVDMGHGYLRSSRVAWGRRFRIDEVRLPADRSIGFSQLEAEFRQSTLLLEASREPIERLVGVLEDVSGGAISLEYKIVGSKFRVIDWDTRDDDRVLRRVCASFA